MHLCVLLSCFGSSVKLCLIYELLFLFSAALSVCFLLMCYPLSMFQFNAVMTYLL